MELLRYLYFLERLQGDLLQTLRSPSEGWTGWGWVRAENRQLAAPQFTSGLQTKFTLEDGDGKLSDLTGMTN